MSAESGKRLPMQHVILLEQRMVSGRQRRFERKGGTGRSCRCDDHLEGSVASSFGWGTSVLHLIRKENSQSVLSSFLDRELNHAQPPPPPAPLLFPPVHPSSSVRSSSCRTKFVWLRASLGPLLMRLLPPTLPTSPVCSLGGG